MLVTREPAHGFVYRLASSAFLTRTLLVLSAVACALVTLAFLSNPFSDFFVFWSSGRALMEGVDPYDLPSFRVWQEALGPGSFYIPFFYPIWLAVFFIPLGVLPFPVARGLWVALNLVALGLTLRNLRGFFLDKDSPSLSVSLAAALLFWPLSLDLGLGQFSLVVLFLLVSAYAAFRRNQLVRMGLYLALATSKPHLAALCIVGLLAAAMARRKWQPLAVYLIGVALLAGLGFLINGNWVGEWVKVASQERLGSFTEKTFASVWKLASLLELPFAEQIGIALTIGSVGLILALFLIRAGNKDSADKVFAAAIAVVPLAMPYSLNYDFVLLLAPMYYILGRSGVASAPWRMAAYGAIFVLPGVLLLVTVLRGFDRGFDALLPLGLIVLILTLPSPTKTAAPQENAGSPCLDQ